ncbi:unnamed protein product, partial [Prorocentrum cordatum]
AMVPLLMATVKGNQTRASKSDLAEAKKVLDGARTVVNQLSDIITDTKPPAKAAIKMMVNGQVVMKQARSMNLAITGLF